MRRLGNRRHTTPRPGRAVPVTVTKFYNLAALAPAANPIMIVRVESRSDSPATAAAAQSGLPDVSVLAGNGSFDRRAQAARAAGCRRAGLGRVMPLDCSWLSREQSARQPCLNRPVQVLHCAEIVLDQCPGGHYGGTVLSRFRNVLHRLRRTGDQIGPENHPPSHDSRI